MTAPQNAMENLKPCGGRSKLMCQVLTGRMWVHCWCCVQWMCRHVWWRRCITEDSVGHVASVWWRAVAYSLVPLRSVHSLLRRVTQWGQQVVSRHQDILYCCDDVSYVVLLYSLSSSFK